MNVLNPLGLANRQRERSQYDESYQANYDTDNTLLINNGRSCGYHGIHKRVLISIRGLPTEKEAYELAAKEMIRRDWKFREYWWQFWRVVDPRTLT